MLKRAMRRSMRKLRMRIGDIQLPKPNFLHSRSQIDTYVRPSSRISNSSVGGSDVEDDEAFGPAASEEIEGDHEFAAAGGIPCQFCQVQYPTGQVMRHQLSCRRNQPHTLRRSRPSPTGTSRSRRRAASDNPMPAPSAPPRPRSPSPTEGVPVPPHLTCPITTELFYDPVLATDGHTYERVALERWLRAHNTSPTTREPISTDQLTPNRVVKKMADDFRVECRRRRALYKYRLDVDVAKSDPVPCLENHTMSVYSAQWLNRSSSSSESNINLVHLTGADAEKVADLHGRPTVHPHIVRILGRVEHTDYGILLLQESFLSQTLAQLMQDEGRPLAMETCDALIYQIACALRHLNEQKMLHGHITAANVFVSCDSDRAASISVKINTLHLRPPRMLADDFSSEKCDVYDLGLLAQQLYSFDSYNEDNDLTDRQALFERCLNARAHERPTIDELTDSLHNLILAESESFQSTSSD